jgi:probable HAF family extracellular repeat protein
VKRSILGVLLVLNFVAVGIAASPLLKFTFSDVKANNTAMETDSYGVNNAGAITGDYVDAKGVQHGMILVGKHLTTFNYKKCAAVTGPTGIAAYAINKAGKVAGWCTGTSGLAIGFTWVPGKFVDINFPKGTGTEVAGINDKGDVAGLYLDGSGVQHAFIKKAGGKYKSIDVTGDTSAAAWGINNAGVACVYAFNSAGAYESFLYNGKTFKKIADPKAGSVGTVCHAPNNKGDLAGTYFNSSGNAVGFLYHLGKYFDVKDPKGNLPSTRDDGLNDKLEMVGRYSPTDGSNHGFKATTK